MGSELAKSLNVIERKEFKKLEDVIERGVESFLATGSALKQIRDDKLYRESHKTFETYIKERWMFERSRAYQLIDASEVKKKMSTIVDISPRALEITKESQLRELVNVPNEQLEQVIERAAEIAEDGNVTAKILRQAKHETLETSVEYEDVEEEPAPKTKKESKPDSPQSLSAPIQAVGTRLDTLLKDLAQLSDETGGEWLDMTTIETQAKALKHTIRSGVYWVDCPECNGKGCKMCKQHGWLSRDRKQFLTQKQKDLLGVA